MREYISHVDAEGSKGGAVEVGARRNLERWRKGRNRTLRRVSLSHPPSNPRPAAAVVVERTALSQHAVLFLLPSDLA